MYRYGVSSLPITGRVSTVIKKMIPRVWIISLALFGLFYTNAVHYMRCEDVCEDDEFCGVLTLERGGGRGNYYHATPVLHGLWPQTERYGDSHCVNSPVADVLKADMSCYTDHSFAEHEWDNHGRCAEKSPSLYFAEICKLSKAPLALMAQEKKKNKNLNQIAQSLEDAGYPIWSKNPSTDEISLTVCSGKDLEWYFPEVTDESTSRNWIENNVESSSFGIEFFMWLFGVAGLALAYYMIKIK
jgi:hypothetical protein